MINLHNLLSLVTAAITEVDAYGPEHAKLNDYLGQELGVSRLLGQLNTVELQLELFEQRLAADTVEINLLRDLSGLPRKTRLHPYEEHARSVGNEPSGAAGDRDPVRAPRASEVQEGDLEFAESKEGQA